ncbi:MAG: hypothetical protein ACRD2G_09305 [Terriglobia bacterium]
MAGFLDALKAAQPQQSSFLQALGQAPAGAQTFQPSDPSTGGAEFDLWNPFGPDINTHLKAPGTLDRLLAGTGQGMSNVVRHAGNLTGLESNKNLHQAAALDKPLLDTTAGKVGNFLGTTAITAPFMGGLGGTAARAGGVLGKIAASTLGRGALEGAGQGLLLSDPGQRVEGTLGGGLLGGALPGAGKLGGKLVKGLARTPEAQALLDRGIDLTPGLLRPESQRNASEEAAQSLPMVGAMISRARNNALRGYQQSAVSEAAAPGASIPKGDVDDMLDKAYQSFQPLYDQAKGFPVKPIIMRTQGPDIPLNDAFRSAVTDKGVLASNQERSQVQSFLHNEATRFNGTSDSLLNLRSNIRAKIREAQMDGKTAQSQLLKNAEGPVTQALESQLPPKAMTALRTADSKYGQYKIMEDAVARSKDRSLGMSPTNLSEAVKSATPQGVYARGGGGPLRDLAKQGKAVFDVRSPPTGARVETLLPGMMAGHAHPLLAAPLALARLGMTATRPGRQLAAGTLPIQKAIAAQLGRLSPTALSLGGRYARAGLGAAGLPPLLQQLGQTGLLGTQ